LSAAFARREATFALLAADAGGFQAIFMDSAAGMKVAMLEKRRA